MRFWTALKKNAGYSSFILALFVILVTLLTPVHASGPLAVLNVVGTIIGPDGNPLSGHMTMTLSNPGQNTVTQQQLAAYPVSWPVINGALPFSAQLVPNDAIQPSGTYYVEMLYDQANNLVGSANFYINSASLTYNIGQATPTSLTTSNISYQTPAFTNVANNWTVGQFFTALGWNSGTSFTSNFLNSNTAARNYTFPDNSGTVCISTNCTVASPTFTGATLAGVTTIGTGPTQFNAGGQLSKYAGNVTTGFATEVTQVPVSASCASSGPTTIATGLSATDYYRLTYYLVTVTAGSGGSYNIAVSWKDSSGVTQTTTSSNIALASGGSVQNGTFAMWPATSQNITVTFTASGVGGSPACGGFYILERF